MRDQLDALEELSRIDLAFRQVDVELAEVANHLSELKGDVDRIRELLERERQQLTEAEKLKLSHVAELEAIADKTARSKKRHDAARTNRELEATSRELEVLRREKEERAAEAARLDDLVAQVKASIERHEQDFARLAEVSAAEETAARHRTEELLGRKRGADEARKGAAARLRADILRIYTMVRDRRGTGVADCAGGICRSCHMALPPQLFNQVHRADRIYQCPSCQRILLLRAGAAR